MRSEDENAILRKRLQDLWAAASNLFEPLSFETVYHLQANTSPQNYKTAWRMMHQIRELMSEEPPHMTGTVEIDETYVGGKRQGITPVAKVNNGKAGERFFRSRQFVQQTGRLHTPPVLIKQVQGYQIMDGNHRLAAVFSIPNFFAMLDCWVGHRNKP